MVFWTKEVDKAWRRQSLDLRKWYELTDSMNTKEAIAIANDLQTSLAEVKRTLSDEDPDEVFNDFFLHKILLMLLKDYSKLWGCLANQEVQDSWFSLQDVQDGLRLLNRFGRYQNAQLLKILEHQCTQLEELYQYSLFSSLEAIIKSVKCSICGGDMNSLSCPHIHGNLYRGEIATGIVEVEEILSFAFVKNPMDKRCAIRLASAEDPKGVVFLGQMLRERTISPFKFAGINKTRSVVPDHILRGIGRNDKCTCGSGKKFKKCCENTPTKTRPHFEILHADMALSIDDLVNLFISDPLGLKIRSFS